MSSTPTNTLRRVQHITIVSAATALLLAAPFSFATEISKSSVLATADQKQVETLALKLLASSELKKQKEESLKQFLANPIAKTADGKKTLQNAVDELAFAAALGAANSDPIHPKVTWIWTAPRTWLGHAVPGSRFAIDNPDNVYRIVTVDATSKYEIVGHTKQPGPVQFSFLLYDSLLGENTKQKNFDDPISGLRDNDIKVDKDGSFKITLDSEPANGRVNHIQSNADAKILIIRNTFNDWAKQTPQEVQIRRVGGPQVAALSTDRELAQKAADYLKAGTDTLFKFQSKGQWSIDHPNELSKPFLRGGGWGFASAGNFKLGKDQALLLTLDPAGARYLSVDLTDPWWVSREHIRANGNLNNVAAQPNKDGSFTYVIAAKDPGVKNWLDTGGLKTGSILIRWQALPETTKSADGAVREVKVVKLSELPKLLPSEVAKVSPVQRKEFYAQRAQDYAHRYLAD